ncbi:MAG: hypothetical protein AB7H92_18620 [Microbacteriaceae bacterium]
MTEYMIDGEPMSLDAIAAERDRLVRDAVTLDAAGCYRLYLLTNALEAEAADQADAARRVDLERVATTMAAAAEADSGRVAAEPKPKRRRSRRKPD